MAWVKDSGPYTALIILAIVGALLFAVGWIAGWPARRSLKDFALWTASGLVFGALVRARRMSIHSPASLLMEPAHRAPQRFHAVAADHIWHPLGADVAARRAEMIFIGLVSYESDLRQRSGMARPRGWFRDRS